MLDTNTLQPKRHTHTHTTHRRGDAALTNEKRTWNPIRMIGSLARYDIIRFVLSSCVFSCADRQIDCVFVCLSVCGAAFRSAAAAPVAVRNRRHFNCDARRGFISYDPNARAAHNAHRGFYFETTAFPIFLHANEHLCTWARTQTIDKSNGAVGFQSSIVAFVRMCSAYSNIERFLIGDLLVTCE